LCFAIFVVFSRFGVVFFFSGGFAAEKFMLFCRFLAPAVVLFENGVKSLTFHRFFCVLRFFLIFVLFVLIFSWRISAENSIVFCGFFGSGGCFV